MSPQLSHVARWVPFLLLIMSFLIGWAFLGLIVSGQDMVASLYPSGILAAGRIIILRWAPQHGSRAAMAWVVFNLSLTFIGCLFNPFLSIYSFSGYIDIEYLLESRHAVPAGISTAMVTAAGQAGGLRGMSAVVWSYPLLAAVNIGIMLVMLATRRDRDRQVRAKEAAMRQLAETKAVNLELHQYLVEQARCMGIEQERGRLSREIHDTVAQGLVGIITQRDFRYLGDEKYVRDVMTPKEKLITAHEGASKEEIRRLLHKHRIEKLLLVDDSFALKGLVTVKDLRSTKEYPRACKDREESLRVGAAVGVGEETFERAEALVRAGVDVLVVDTAHGHSKKVQELRYQYADLLLVGGNIATAEGALDLVKAGADVVKVGIGPGSICTTRIVAGVGVPQLSAVMNVAKALEGTGKTLIADGGLRYSGDIAKAIAGGAHAVMVGSLLAGTEEAPGTVELYQGRSYKSYRGMGSLGAMNMAHGSADRYGQGGREESKRTPEGIEGRVPYRGPLAGVIDQLVGGLESSMGYVGCANLAQMRSEPDFVRISNAGMNESHVHDVTITKEPPNYRRG